MIAWTMLLLVGLAAADEPVAEKQELDKLQGTWTIVSLSIGDRQAILDEHTRDDRSVIEGNKLTVMKGGQASHSSTFRIDPSKNPKEIDHIFERDGKTSITKGIYKLEGDLLTVCSGLGENERPERFESTEENTLTLLKRTDK